MREQLRLSILLIVSILLGSISTVGRAEDNLSGHRTAEFFQRGYSAYVFLQPSTAEHWEFDIYLQFLHSYTAEQEIEGYRAVVDGKTVETPINADGVDKQPGVVHFAGTVKMDNDVKKISIIPYTTTGEIKDEAISVYDASEKSELPAHTAIVNNPVSTDKLNLRIAPVADGDVLRQYYNGTEVDVLNAMPDGWVAVSIGQKGGMARGYMKADYLAFGKDGNAVESVIPSYEAILESWTLYSYPDEDTKPVGQYKKGQSFEVLARSSSWWHIAVDDVTGFVRADLLIQNEPVMENNDLSSTSTAIPEAIADTTLPPMETASPTNNDGKQ